MCIPNLSETQVHISPSQGNSLSESVRSGVSSICVTKPKSIEIQEAEALKIQRKRKAVNAEALTKGWVTQRELKEKYLYLSEQGIFIRRKFIQGAGYAGTKAGHTNKHGYPRISIGRKQYLCHRLAWLYVYGEWPANLDHINGDRADFRIANLREVTQSLNGKNAVLHSTNTSGETGVGYIKQTKKWAVRITHYGETISGGHYELFEDACRARRELAAKYGYHENHGKRQQQEVQL